MTSCAELLRQVMPAMVARKVSFQFFPVHWNLPSVLWCFLSSLSRHANQCLSFLHHIWCSLSVYEVAQSTYDSLSPRSVNMSSPMTSTVEVSEVAKRCTWFGCWGLCTHLATFSWAVWALLTQQDSPIGSQPGWEKWSCEIWWRETVGGHVCMGEIFSTSSSLCPFGALNCTPPSSPILDMIGAGPYWRHGSKGVSSWTLTSKVTTKLECSFFHAC